MYPKRDMRSTAQDIETASDRNQWASTSFSIQERALPRLAGRITPSLIRLFRERCVSPPAHRSILLARPINGRIRYRSPMPIGRYTKAFVMTNIVAAVSIALVTLLGECGFASAQEKVDGKRRKS